MQGIQAMAFSIFQTASAIWIEVETNVSGDDVQVSSQTVEVDPTFGVQRGFNVEGEEITGISTIVTGLSNIDETKRYKLTYNNQTYNVEQITPFYSIGGNVLEHIEVLLR